MGGVGDADEVLDVYDRKCDDEVDGEWALQLLGLLLNHECTNSVNECSLSFSPIILVKHICLIYFI